MVEYIVKKDGIKLILIEVKQRHAITDKAAINRITGSILTKEENKLLSKGRALVIIGKDAEALRLETSPQLFSSK